MGSSSLSAAGVWRRFAQRYVPIVLILVAGCAARRESDVAASGDPEADQRAEQRVGAKDSGNAKTHERTLYERLGGAETISALVDDFVARSIADPRVNFERRNLPTGILERKHPAWDPTPTNVEKLKQHMVEFLTLASGGPAQYTGREVREVHQGMKITNSEFDAMVGDIKASMDRLGLPTREKRDLLAIVETTRKQIVEK
jgi:hemoglobin